MLKQYYKKSLPAALMGLAMTTMAPAYAGGGYAADGAVPTIKTTAANVVNIMGTMAGTNVNTAGSLAILQSNFGLLGEGFVNGRLTDIAGKINAQTEAIRQLSDLQTENLFYIQGAMAMADREKNVDTIDSMIDVCIAAASAVRTQEGRAAASSEQRTVEQQSVARTTTTSNSMAASSRASQLHERDYCSVEENVFGKCEVVSEFPNADISPASLTRGAVKMVPDGAPEVIKDASGEVVAVNAKMKVKEGEPQERLTFSEDQVKAAALFLNNTVNPRPDEMASKELQKNPAYDNYMSMFIARAARIEQAAAAGNEMMAERMPTVRFTEWTELAKSLGLPETYSDWYKDNLGVDGKISVAQLRKFEATKRARSEDWHKDLIDKSSNDREVEALTMAALQLDLTLKQIELLESINMNLSVILANDLTPATKEAVNALRPVEK